MTAAEKQERDEAAREAMRARAAVNIKRFAAIVRQPVIQS